MDDFNKTPNIYPNLNAIPLNANISNEQQFRLNKINEIKDHFLFYLYYQEVFLLHHLQLLLEHLQE